MSATTPCTPCCTTPQTVNIPGAQGPQGGNGTNGQNAFTLTTADFVVPAVASPVTVSVASSLPFVIGQKVIVGQGPGAALAGPGPGTFQVLTIPSVASLQLTFLGYSGDVAPGQTISSGAVVSPAGVQSAFPTTTKGDLIVDDGVNNPNPDPKRLPVGVNGQSLFADSTQAKGVKYAGASQTLNVNTTSTPTGGAAAGYDLISYAIAAATLFTNGDSIEFEAMFDIAANGNAKTVEVDFGGSVVATYGPVTQNGGTILLRGRVIRTGANAEYFYGMALATTGAGAGAVYAADGTLAVNTGAGITIKGRGTNGSASADITQKSLFVRYVSAT